MFYVLCIAIVVGIVALDQVVKALVCANIAVGETISFLPGVMHLTQLHNEGAAFSILVGQRWPQILLTFVDLAVVVILIAKKVLRRRSELISLAIVTGGAIGNLIDRIVHGYVVDMFALDLFQFPVFNVADIFVVCGGIAFCIAFLLPNKSEARHDS